MKRKLNKKIKLGLYLALIVGAGFFHSAKAGSTDFVFSFKDKTFPISNELISAWQGREALYLNNALNDNQGTFTTSILEALGQAQQKNQNYKIYSYKLAPIYNYISNLSGNINLPKVEPQLEIKDSRVVNFQGPQSGVQVDIYKSAMDALLALEIGNLSTNITAYETVPEKNLGDSNNLGIKELIAEGVSNFKGSPKNRRINIAVGIEKFKGIIIQKGEEFSFNKYLGDVDGEHGFLPELVIKAEGTIPEFGGGLCQVSSTTFRAAMAAGLPITARRNHAYAVQYYSPQGTDATIYPGSADLKFINDTPGAILIWPYEKDANTLVFDFYGTKDARKVILQTPVAYDRTPDGAMKATWTRLVTSALGQTRTDVFKSNYQSPALFHKTESFVTAPTSTPNSIKPKI